MPAGRATLVSYRVDCVRGDTCMFIAAGDEGVWAGASVINESFTYESERDRRGTSGAGAGFGTAPAAR
jgi:hypothetical protein